MDNKNSINIGLIVLIACFTLIIGLLGGYFLFNYIKDIEQSENIDKSELPKEDGGSNNEVSKKEVTVETGLHHIDNKNNDIKIPKIVNGGSAAEKINYEIIMDIYEDSYWYQNAVEWKETGCEGTYEYTKKNGILVIFAKVSPKGEFMEGGLISRTRDSYYFYDIENDKRLNPDEAIIALGLQGRLEEIQSSIDTCSSAGFIWENNDIKLEPNCP